MPVTDTPRSAGPFIGDGSVTALPFNFRVFAGTDLLVQATTGATIADLSLGTDYTVALNGDQAATPGGTVNLSAALAVGTTATIIGALPYTQTAALPQGGNYSAIVVQNALDRGAMLLQQLQELATRSLTVQPGELARPLPAAAGRASQIYGFDEVGTPTLYAPSAVTMNIVSQPQSETRTMPAGTTLINISGFTYPSSKPNAITVFMDGQEIGDFTQTSDSSYTLSTATAGAHDFTVTTNAFASFGSGKTSASDSTTTGTDGASYQFHRNVNYSGGTPGFVNACLWADTTVANAGATSFEWAGLFVMRNHATAGENVGLYAQGNKYVGAGPTWGLTAEIIDWGTGNPTSGAVAAEVDVSANGTDNNNNRVGVDLVFRRQGHTGAAMECAYGLRFNSDDPDLTQALLKTAIGFTSGAHIGIGIDFSAATIFGAAAKLSAGQVFQWGNGTGAAARQLTHTGTGLAFQDATGTNPALWLLNDNGTLLVQGKQLLSAPAQQAGWVVMTGALDHTTAFPVASVTTTQLASRVAAMEYLMLQHGLMHV